MAAGTVARNVSPSRGMDVYGHSAVCPFQYTGPSTYPTGGDPQAAGVFKLGVVEAIGDFLGVNAGGTAAISFHYNCATNKMQAFWDNGVGAAMSEVTNNTDLSAYVGNSVAYGKG